MVNVGLHRRHPLPKDHIFYAEALAEHKKLVLDKKEELPMNSMMPRPWTRIVKSICAACLAFACFHVAGCGVVPAGHSFLCCDLGKNAVIRVNDKGQATWEYSITRAHDVWALPKDHVLVASETIGIVEVAPDKTVVWSYRAPDGLLWSCQPLADGRVLTAVKVSGGVRIREIARDGSVSKEIASHRDPGEIRLCRKTPEGTYLLAARGARQVWEYDADGKLLRTFDAPGNVYLGVRTARGTTLIACGDGHALVEMDNDNRIIWKLGEHDLEGIPLRFVAGFQELPNGNIVFCNWLGHGKFTGETQVIEINRKKEVVWKVNDWKALAFVSHIQLLDQGEAPVRR